MSLNKHQGLARWWIYQRERFPLGAHLPLIAAFSGAAVGFSAALRGAEPSLASFAAAFVTSAAAFAQLRISDEFKDFEEDRRYRPYRPVPRGLVTLRELGALALWLALAQAAAALLLDARLLLPLLLCWGWLALMGREFFLGEYLRARPFAYMAAHMAVMPVIDFYATACDWLPAGGGVPEGLFWFVTASFFNGMVLETGRKIRHPADEEPGVKTYSLLWGRPRACLFWLGSMAASLVCAALAAARTGNPWPLQLLGPLLAAAAVWAARFLQGTSPFFLRLTRGGHVKVTDPRQARLLGTGPGSGVWFERFSGIWTLVLYVSLGLIPLLTQSR